MKKNALNPRRMATWPENVGSVQVFSFAGFIIRALVLSTSKQQKYLFCTEFEFLKVQPYYFCSLPTKKKKKKKKVDSWRHVHGCCHTRRTRSWRHILSKCQALAAVFSTFQTSIFNKLGHKWTEKLLWLCALIPFLRTGPVNWPSSVGIKSGWNATVVSSPYLCGIIFTKTSKKSTCSCPST